MVRISLPYNLYLTLRNKKSDFYYFYYFSVKADSHNIHNSDSKVNMVKVRDAGCYS